MRALESACCLPLVVVAGVHLVCRPCVDEDASDDMTIRETSDRIDRAVSAVEDPAQKAALSVENQQLSDHVCNMPAAVEEVLPEAVNREERNEEAPEHMTVSTTSDRVAKAVGCPAEHTGGR